MSEQVLHILGDAIPYTYSQCRINKLRFLKENPRVSDYVQATPGFNRMSVDEQQQIIYKGLLEESSVTELIPEIRHHKGLMEPLLVQHQTMEVVEGNSRLAAFRRLYEQDRGGDWEWLPCIIVTGLTDRQRAAYLAQVHVKGKRQWSPYEKANFAFVQKERGDTYGEVATVFDVSPATIRIQVKIIEMMKSNNDREQSNFSYYNVMVRSREIRNALREESVRAVLLDKVKSFGTGSTKEFTAQELRDRLPEVLQKPKVKKKFLRGDIDLDEAYQRARRSKTEHKVRRAAGILDAISRTEVEALAQGDFNALRYRVRKLAKIVERLQRIVDTTATEN